MTIMLPPTHMAAAARPILQERRFRLMLRCNECQHEAPQIVSLVDEPNDPASEEDFAESGALDQLDYACEKCGCDTAVLTGLDYLKRPTDV